MLFKQGAIVLCAAILSSSCIEAMPTEIIPTIGVINGSSEAVEISTEKSIENGSSEAGSSSEESIENGSSEAVEISTEKSSENGSLEAVSSTEKSIENGTSETMKISTEKSIENGSSEAVSSTEKSIENGTSETMEISTEKSIENSSSEAVSSTEKSIKNVTDPSENEVAPIKISFKDMNGIGDEEFHKITDAIVGPYDSHSDDAVSSLFSSPPMDMSSLPNQYMKLFPDMENGFQLKIDGLVFDDKTGRVISDTEKLTTVTKEPKSSAGFVADDDFKLAVKDAVKSAVSEVVNEVIVDLAKDILHRYDANMRSKSES